MRIMFLLILLVTVTAHARAQTELGWLGSAGDTGCSKWNEVRAKKTSKTEMALKSWVLGFVSGVHNAPSATRFLSSFNEKDVLTRVDTYCRDHKGDLLVQATMNAVANLLQTSSNLGANQQRSVTVSDDSPALPGIAAATVKLLADEGWQPKGNGQGGLVVEIKQLHCDQYSVIPMGPSDPGAKQPAVMCRINAENIKGTTSGQLLRGGRALMDILVKIQETQISSGLRFMDCAMGGYCATYIESIECISDKKTQNVDRKAQWTCTFKNG